MTIESHNRINGYSCIFPSDRNREWEYRRYLDTARDFYEAFTGSYTHRRDPRREKTIPKIASKWESSLEMRAKEDNFRSNSFGAKHYSTLSRNNSPDIRETKIERMLHQEIISPCSEEPASKKDKFYTEEKTKKPNAT